MAKKSTPSTLSSKSKPGSKAHLGGSDGENVQGYFRSIFKENRKLIWERSNDALFERWLRDHPGAKEVPERVKQGLANLKSILRKKLARRGRKRRAELAAGTANGASSSVPISAASKPRGLDQLEAQIDDALALAKHLDRDGLHDIIRLLRKARNRVVLLVG